jgi:hypothetical protein
MSRRISGVLVPAGAAGGTGFWLCWREARNPMPFQAALWDYPRETRCTKEFGLSVAEVSVKVRVTGVPVNG